jgi:hypothetical protein
MLNTIATKKLMPFSASILSSALLGSFEPPQGNNNTLTEEEKKAGRVLLFNGRNTHGWRTCNNKLYDNRQVIDGQLHCKEKDVNRRANLITTDQYDNFELSAGWKIGKPIWGTG